MSYGTVTAGRVLDAVLRGRGFDADYHTLSTKELEQYADAVNHAIRTAWERARWPQTMVCERRQYRPAYDAAQSYNEGHQVYYDEAYWESLVDGNLANTPAEGDYWTELALEDDMILSLPFAQPWANDDGESVQAFEAPGVDLEAFAYDLDPLLTPRARPVRGCRFWEDSVILPADGTAPLRPYVRFRPRAPKISYTAWAAGTAYAAGERVYVAADKVSYLALIPSTGAAPAESPESWAPIGVPEMFFDYIRLRCRAEYAAEDEGKWKSLAMADEELERLEAVYLAGTNDRGPATVRVARRGRAYGIDR